MPIAKFLLSTLLLGVLLSASLGIAKNDKSASPTVAKAVVFKIDGNDPSTRAGGLIAAPPKELASTQIVVRPRKIALFSRPENAVIRDYFLQHPAPATALPPDIAKDYVRGEVLPLGIEKKVLPWGLMKRLPLRIGCEYAQIGRDVVLIDTETLVVVDIMKDIFN